MAYFPNSIMPKRLRKETEREVDGSPYIYNAKDYNTHHRELLEIEKALIAESPNENNPISIEKALVLLEKTFNNLTSGGLISRATGVILAGTAIQLPDYIISTNTGAAVAHDATSMTVDSTVGFPSSGYITKINKITIDDDGYYDNLDSMPYRSEEPDLDDGKITFQEVIGYTSKTATAFYGLTRGLFGTRAQDLAAPSESVADAKIISGRASLSYSPLGLKTAASTMNKMTLYHTQDLILKAYFSGRNANSVSTAELTDAVCHIGYSLLVVGQYEKINLSGLLAG